MILILPRSLVEDNILEFLVNLGKYNQYDPITLDFGKLEYFDLISMTAMLGKVYQWTQSKKKVLIRFNENSTPVPYMQRMDFFSHCGIDLENNSFSLKEVDRFVSFKRIGSGGSFNSGVIASEIATCLAPEQAEIEDNDKTGFFDCIEYCVSELMLNVIQHSKGVGFIGAQYYPEKGITQIAITDSGIGVKNSFIQNNSPHKKDIKSDIDALRISIQARVSSKSHLIEPWGGGCENAGIGLTILRDIAIASGGSYNLVSGSAALINDTEHSLEEDDRFDGTYVGFSFKNIKLNQFAEYLERAKVNLGISNESLDWTEDAHDWLAEYK